MSGGKPCCKLMEPNEYVDILDYGIPKRCNKSPSLDLGWEYGIMMDRNAGRTDKKHSCRITASTEWHSWPKSSYDQSSLFEMKIGFHAELLATFASGGKPKDSVGQPLKLSDEAIRLSAIAATAHSFEGVPGVFSFFDIKANVGILAFDLHAKTFTEVQQPGGIFNLNCAGSECLHLRWPLKDDELPALLALTVGRGNHRIEPLYIMVLHGHC